MIRPVCRYVTLAEVRDLPAGDEYEKMVRPLGYEFGLERNAVYVVIGLRTRSGTAWLYVAAAKGEKELQFVPAVLFSFDWNEIPAGWRMRVTGRGDIELLPTSLAVIEDWFEKYVDGDPVVVDVVNHEVERHR